MSESTVRRAGMYLKYPLRSVVMPLRFAVVLWALACTSCAREPRPSATDLEGALRTQMPPFIRIAQFSVEAIENIGTKVEPSWHARFRARITTESPTFLEDGSEDSGVVFLRPVRKAGDAIEIFGKSMSSLQAGVWHTTTELEGNPISALGQPQTAFSQRKTIIRGTQAEVAYREEQEALRRAEQERAAAKAAAAREAQQPSRVIGKYKYIASYRESTSGRITYAPVFGTLTLTDVDLALSGEQPNGSTQPKRITFLESFASEATLWSHNFHGSLGDLTDFRVGWRPFWATYDHTELRFSTAEERDIFSRNLTDALQEWAGKHGQFAVGRLTVR